MTVDVCCHKVVVTVTWMCCRKPPLYSSSNQTTSWQFLLHDISWLCPLLFQCITAQPRIFIEHYPVVLLWFLLHFFIHLLFWHHFYLALFEQPFEVLCGCLCKAQFGPLVLSRVLQSPPLISNINCLSLSCSSANVSMTLHWGCWMLAATLLRAHLSTTCFPSKCLSRWLCQHGFPLMSSLISGAQWPYFCLTCLDDGHEIRNTYCLIPSQ